MRYRRLTPTVLRLDLRRRPHVNQAVKIIVVDIIVERSDVDAARGFIADAEHLRPVALGCNVLVTPPAILEPDAPGRGPFTFEPDALRLRAISRQTLGERHLHRGHESDGHAHVFALRRSGCSQRNAEQQARHEERLEWLEHVGETFRRLRVCKGAAGLKCRYSPRYLSAIWM